MDFLSKEDIIKVVEGKEHAERVPLMYDIWIYDNMFGDDPQKRQAWLQQYPCDVDHIFMQFPGITEGPKEDPDFFWGIPGAAPVEGAGLDSQCLIRDWEDEEAVEAFYASFPDPDSPALIVGNKQRDGRYLLGRWWDCFFERLWRLRGMENALTDFYLYPEQVHRLFDRLSKFYMRVMERAKEAWDVDGFLYQMISGHRRRRSFHWIFSGNFLRIIIKGCLIRRMNLARISGCTAVGILRCFCRISLKSDWM